MPVVSPLSQVHPTAVIADDVEIGPFCVVGPHVSIGAGTRLLSHVVLMGHTRIGRQNIFYPHSVVGGDPQDKKYRGGATHLEMGDGNVIREAVTIHTGTEVAGGITRIGNQNLLMINCHVAHDVQMGNHCILANNVMLAGHVVLGDCVNMMGMGGVHHFVTIGDYAYIGGMARIRHDVPPFVKVDGADHIRGLNKEGLKRARFSTSDIEALTAACRRLFLGKRVLSVAMKSLAGENDLNPHVRRLLDFLHRRDLGKHGRYLESLRTTEPASSR